MADVRRCSPRHRARSCRLRHLADDATVATTVRCATKLARLPKWLGTADGLGARFVLASGTGGLGVLATSPVAICTSGAGAGQARRLLTPTMLLDSRPTRQIRKMPAAAASLSPMLNVLRRRRASTSASATRLQ
jgi:hypothetical protein